ncbi:ABC transporter substrate-binding protein [Bradyrhizobium sp. CIR3A]|uniref:ABC transporter substrate-binding protein n=1 Tax=Bradyrhizobium sp. CIR3A TaxID=2663838 RepID=UPI001606765F|nr:ABC transporter substrate-binding protein [Bradyrhizobium sp. CIR3A]MBB4261354.1 branched-chain amino acid transport system substrate-binding protein [Bradyrhizobium sp. CIR3A]
MATQSLKELGTAALAASALFVTFGSASAFQDDGTIVICSIEPLSGVGTALGAPNYYGKQIAVDEINAAGGIEVGGKKIKFKLISEDDQTKPEQGVPLFRKCAESDRALVITGSQYSRVTESMWGLLQKRLGDSSDVGLQVPSMSFLSMKAGITSVSPWAFRNAGNEPAQHELTMKLMEDRFGPFKHYSGAIEANEAHSVAAWKAAYSPALERRNTKPSEYVEWYETDRDFSVQIRKLKRADTDFLILSSHFQANVGALLEAQRQGFKPKMIVSHIGADAIEMIDLGKKASEGIVFPTAIHMAFPEPKVKWLAEEYQRRTKEKYMPQFVGLGYEGIMIIKDAIMKAGIENTPDSLAVDRRKVRDQLAAVKNYKSFAGMTLSMNENRDIERPIYLVRIQDGQFRLYWTPDRGFLF